MPSESKNLFIVVKMENGEEQVFPFDRRSITVGSGSTADMRIEGKGVSVSHAVFEKRDDGVFLTDLATPTGTFVNDEKITKKRIEPGDVIRIGSVVLGLKVEGEEDAEEPAEDASAAGVAAEAKSDEISEQESAPQEEPAKEEPKAEAAEDSTEEKEEQESKAEAEPKEETAAKEESAPAEDTKPETVEQEKVEAKKEEPKPEEKKEDVKAAKIGVDEEKAKKLKAARKKKKLRRAYVLQIAPPAEKLEKPENKISLEVREIGWKQALLSVKQYNKSNVKITVGEGKENDFFIPDEFIPGDPFVLAERNGDSCTVYFGSEQDGLFLDKKEGEKPLKDVAKSSGGNVFSIDIRPGQAVHVHFKDISYYIRFIEAEKVAPMPLTQRINWNDLALWLIAYALWALMIYQISIMPEPETPDVFEGKVRTVEVAVEDEKEEEPEPEPEEPLVANNQPAQKAMGEEGKIGDKKALLDKAKGGARAAAEQLANNSGLLAGLDSGNEARDQMFSGMVAQDLQDNLGTLQGPQGVSQKGAAGLGAFGSGMGGGGTGLGLGGGIGTRGRGGGYGRWGIGAGKLGKRKGRLGKLKSGRFVAKGSLSREIIAKIIRKHTNQLRHCYQKELRKNPNLYGKITVKFTIGSTGRVMRANVVATTMRNTAVEDCIERVIRHIIFPKPKGGIVVVKYPFVFKPL